MEAPNDEFNETNLPSYYPENGIWFNNEDVSIKDK
jgi:hypothetical protein